MFSINHSKYTSTMVRNGARTLRKKRRAKKNTKISPTIATTHSHLVASNHLPSPSFRQGKCFTRSFRLGTKKHTIVHPTRNSWKQRDFVRQNWAAPQLFRKSFHGVSMKKSHRQGEEGNMVSMHKKMLKIPCQGILSNASGSARILIFPKDFLLDFCFDASSKIDNLLLPSTKHTLEQL